MAGIEALATTRTEYTGEVFDQVADTPYAQFVAWYEAAAGSVEEPNAMVVSTVDDLGPDSRIVLLKEFSPAGFVFYTNYDSAKGRQLAAGPGVALLFPWHTTRRQVRVRGVARRASPEESDAYFALRPRGSQIGALASKQSQPVGSRAELQEAFSIAEAAAPNRIPRPDNWGGFVVTAFAVEFWQGGHDRLHDRFVYKTRSGACEPLDSATAWVAERLYP